MKKFSQFFNEQIASMGFAPIETEAPCTFDGELIPADDPIRSEFYPDALFCSKECRQRFDEAEAPDLPPYYNDINREDY
jgi:hypothetical protein